MVRSDKTTTEKRCSTAKSGWRDSIPGRAFEKVVITVSTFLAIVVLVAGVPSKASKEAAFPAHEMASSRAYVAIVTAYSSSPEETDGDPWTTASGKPVREGIVACSGKYPFGTKFLIEGEVYECLDRLAPRYDHRIDIWKSSKLEALEYGKKELQVQLVEDDA